MFMKKIPNVITAQRILKPSLLVLIIAGSGFLPNASAVRWTVDFQNKQGKCIEASDLAGFVTILNAPESDRVILSLKNFVQTRDFFEKSKEAGVEHEQTNRFAPGRTIVLKNGILYASEAKKLLSGACGAFDIEFINCRGTLDLNEDLKKYANSILIQDCEFETASDCFKNTKHLKFSDTTLTPENGRLGIDENAEVRFGGNNKVSPYNMPLEIVLALEQRGEMPCVPNDKSERTGEEVSKLKENYERMKELNRKLLKEKQKQRQTIEALKKQTEDLKREHRDKIAKMQRAREEDMRKLKEKYGKKIKNFENTTKTKELNELKEELKRRDKDIEAKNKRIKDLEEYTEGSKNACAKAVAKIKELEALVEDKQRELEGKNFDLASGKNKAPAISDSQDHDAAPAS